MNLDKKLLTTLASGVATCLSPAATITSDVADASARASNSTGQSGNATLFAGSYYAVDPGIVPVFPFLLPTLGAGESFATATLTLELAARFSPPVTFNGDLVGLDRIDVSTVILGSDWERSGSLLHDDFYTPESELGVSTSNDFVGWLNMQYAEGVNASSFVFIRVNAEGIISEAAAYSTATADNTTLQRPTLTYTAIPEPSSTLLIGLGSLALLTRRRK